MASKDRILRLKEDTRVNILDAAFNIVKEEGWQALSMRKIADVIEYTAPIIYEYFANKEAILQELTRKGYRLLSERLESARDRNNAPEDQMEAMWLAYWDFAFEEKELYQLMFGVEMNCCILKKESPEMKAPSKLFSDVIRELMKDPTGDDVCTKYYTYWSVVHGLVSINIVRQGATEEINQQILRAAIKAITASLKI